MSDLHCYLRHEMSARGWGVRQLASALEVRFGVAARWVSGNPETRVVPKPDTLMRIAEALDLDIYEVFRRAGYLPSVNTTSCPHPHEAETRLFLQRFQRMMRNTRNFSDIQWALAAVVFTTQLENMQQLLDRLEQQLPQ